MKLCQILTLSAGVRLTHCSSNKWGTVCLSSLAEI